VSIGTAHATLQHSTAQATGVGVFAPRAGTAPQTTTISKDAPTSKSKSQLTVDTSSTAASTASCPTEPLSVAMESPSNPPQSYVGTSAAALRTTGRSTTDGVADGISNTVVSYTGGENRADLPVYVAWILLCLVISHMLSNQAWITGKARSH
jgi:hypothetical protein